MWKLRCIGTKRDGKRCERRALAGSKRCSIHPEQKRIKRVGRRAVNVSISAEGRARLTMLAAELGVSRSELIEQWIEGAPWPDDRTNDG